MKVSHRDLYPLRRHSHYVSIHQLLYRRRILVRDEPAAHLRHRFRRQHSLGAFAGVAAEKSVHFAGWPRPDLFQNGVALLASKGGGSDFLFELLLIEWKVAHLLENARLPVANVIVEPVDGDVSVLVMQCRQNPRQHHRRIYNSATVAARVQITRRALDVDLEVREPAK